MMGGGYSIFNQSYPQYDEKATVLDENRAGGADKFQAARKNKRGKRAPKEDIENAALGALGLERSAVKKIIIVPNRLVNIIA